MLDRRRTRSFWCRRARNSIALRPCRSEDHVRRRRHSVRFALALVEPRPYADFCPLGNPKRQTRPTPRSHSRTTHHGGLACRLSARRRQQRASRRARRAAVGVARRCGPGRRCRCFDAGGVKGGSGLLLSGTVFAVEMVTAGRIACTAGDCSTGGSRELQQASLGDRRRLPG